MTPTTTRPGCVAPGRPITRRIPHAGLVAVAAAVLSGFPGPTASQTTPGPAPVGLRDLAPEARAARLAEGVEVDDGGVLRWRMDGAEVALFGVNYATPFAHGYRAHERLGIDRREAIDTDVAHIARLGLDAYRVHVWDREITDPDGNLLDNEHLALLDYLIARLADHGIATVLTPIAWWGNGYPEPDTDTDGLSDAFSKGAMTTDPAARAPTRNYLRQFAAHVNPHTGHTYADDPHVLFFEIFNEPEHPGTPDETTDYVTDMARTLREAGVDKPIFYNISQSYREPRGRAVCRAEIDGVSHQWYPTGLVRGGAIGGTLTPNVDRYTIPYADFPECADKARMVYEFDSADVLDPTLYPVMARSFRGAGFQWATQFAWDALALAGVNTDYQTHWLNLVHTPAKAIGFAVAARVFRSLPRGFESPAFPDGLRFGAARVDPDADLAEWVDAASFLHSAPTTTRPPDPAALRELAGVGSDPFVRYEGTGAWFLDRIDRGVWRLEVLPDVLIEEDPFGRSAPGRRITRIVGRARPIEVALPDLGADFTVRRVVAAGPGEPGAGIGRVDDPVAVADGGFTVEPGAYLLVAAEAAPPATVAGPLPVPGPTDAPPLVLHTPPDQVGGGRDLAVRLTVSAAAAPDSVVLWARRVGGPGRPWRGVMEASGGFDYAASVPADRVVPGLLEYAATVFGSDGTVRTWPADAEGAPFGWTFEGGDWWRVPVAQAGTPLRLFDARRDLDEILYPHPWDYVDFDTEVVPGATPGSLALRAVVEDFTPAPHHLAVRTFLPESRQVRLPELAPGIASSGGVLHVRARSADGGPSRLEVALVDGDGVAWGAVLDVGPAWEDHLVPLDSLRPVPLALLPRPYPQFLPYLFESSSTASTLDVDRIEGVQFAIHADLFAATGGTVPPRGFEVESVTLAPRSRD